MADDTPGGMYRLILTQEKNNPYSVLAYILATITQERNAEVFVNYLGASKMYFSILDRRCQESLEVEGCENKTPYKWIVLYRVLN